MTPCEPHLLNISRRPRVQALLMIKRLPVLIRRDLLVQRQIMFVVGFEVVVPERIDGGADDAG